MKRLLCLFLTLLITVLCCACGKVENTSASSEQLTYYYTEQYMDQMIDIIKRYNRWCGSHSTDDMKIKLVEFEDYDTMSERLNIEVMSGGGPDLFSNYMNLPFEKLMQNGAFLDLNELIDSDTSEDRIDLNDYNKTIMDSGVRNGKRYYIPAFYRVDTLVGYEQVFEKYHMPTQQGYHLTFENMQDVFCDYLQNPGEYYFMSDELWSGGANADSVIMKLINSRVDFEKKTTSFDDDFKDKLSFLMKLKEHSSTSLFEDTGDSESREVKPFLFSYFETYSNPIRMERMRKTTEGDNPNSSTDRKVLYSCFEIDDSTYSAGIDYALFVNANTKKSDKVLAFLKYLLGEHLQNLYAGTQEEYWYGGGADCLPVLNSVFEGCVRDSYNIHDDEGNVIGKKENLDPTTQALLSHIERINSVNLFTDVYFDYYSNNVVLPILQDYYDGKINIDKFADNLTTATKIFIEE